MQKLNQIDYTELKRQLVPRTIDAHKGDFGHVLVVGGDVGYAGAPVISALGALKVGAGLVTIASQSSNLIGINASHPEIMTCAIDEPTALKAILAKASVVILGPGLGRTSWSRDTFLAASQTNLPLVLDADGLYWLAQTKQQRNNWILTPHPGEAATLLNHTKPLTDVERFSAIQKLIATHYATVVLKGAGSLVGSPNAEIQVCNAGNPGMASGGMGDLLSGIIGGLVAQHMALDSAAKLGVIVHAMAGDIVAKTYGQRGIIATDLLPAIQKLIN